MKQSRNIKVQKASLSGNVSMQSGKKQLSHIQLDKQKVRLNRPAKQTQRQFVGNIKSSKQSLSKTVTTKPVRFKGIVAGKRETSSGILDTAVVISSKRNLAGNINLKDSRRNLPKSINMGRVNQRSYFSKSRTDTEANQSDILQTATDRGKSKQPKRKNIGKMAGQQAVLGMTAQDEQLETINKAHRYYQNTKTGANITKKSAQLTKAAVRHGAQKTSQITKKSYSFTSASAEKVKHTAGLAQSGAKRTAYYVSNPKQALQAAATAIKTFAKTTFKGLSKATIANPLFWIISSFFMLLIIVISVVIAVVATSTVKQDDFDLTESYEQVTKIDSDHSKDGNSFYTNVDNIMLFMNYKFDDYKLDDKITYQKPESADTSSKKSGDFKDYLSDLWTSMNGETDNYSLTPLSDLYDKEPFKLSKDDQDQLNEMTRDGKFLALNELVNPFGKEGEALQIQRRYGYEQVNDKERHYKNIVLQVDARTTLKAPMAGEIDVDGDKVVITQKEIARLTLSKATGLRVKDGDKVKQGQEIGQTLEEDLIVSYEKWNESPGLFHKKKFQEVNPSFYFLNVEYLQQTTLASFNPENDLAQRAITFYNEAKKLNPKTTKQGAAAFLGNFEIEAKINPKRAEGDYLPPPVGASSSSWDDPKWLAMGGLIIYNGSFPNIIHRGLGLGQWTDTADGGRRHTLLLEYAKSKKKKWYELELQVDFALNGDSPMNRTTFRRIIESTAPVESLTREALVFWEGNPGDKLVARTDAAKRWYGYLNSGGGSGKPSATVPPEYKDKVKFPAPNQQAHTGYPGNAYAWGNCTWYVYNREYQLGHVIDPYLGDGGSWGRNAIAKGYKTQSTPKAGFMASYPPGVAGASPIYGHVAFVEYVNPDGSYLVSEMNVQGLDVINYRVVQPAAGTIFINPDK